MNHFQVRDRTEPLLHDADIECEHEHRKIFAQHLNHVERVHVFVVLVKVAELGLFGAGYDLLPSHRVDVLQSGPSDDGRSAAGEANQHCETTERVPHAGQRAALRETNLIRRQVVAQLLAQQRELGEVNVIGLIVGKSLKSGLGCTRTNEPVAFEGRRARL